MSWPYNTSSGVFLFPRELSGQTKAELQFIRDITGHLSLWTPKCIQSWLASLGHEDWGTIFRNNGIEGLDLMDLDADNLRNIGIDDITTCMRLIIGIRDVYTRPLAHQLWEEDRGRKDAATYWERAQALIVQSRV